MISIGVTTYNRKELLVQALRSILDQTHGDFEVLVGNNYQEEHLSPGVLDMEDPRIRYLNHPADLGQAGNMNALLRAAQGEYFTWLADDDVYEPTYLQEVADAVRRFDAPKAVFTSFRCFFGDDTEPPTEVASLGTELMSGRSFLRRVFSHDVRIISVYGVYHRLALERLGGMPALTDCPVALLGEYLLAIKAGTLEDIVYIDAPLLGYRIHDTSYGCMLRGSLGYYARSAAALWKQGVKVLRIDALRPDFARNAIGLMLLVARLVGTRLARSLLACILPGQAVDRMLQRYYTKRIAWENARFDKISPRAGGPRHQGTNDRQQGHNTK